MAVLKAGANGTMDELIQTLCGVNEGKSALDPAVTRILMSNLFEHPEKEAVEPLTDL
jgi:hypothetical protein